MRFTSERGWIEITFDHYAADAGCLRGGLFDEENSVELGFDFSLKGIGWGCVGNEYFLTTDIIAILDFAETQVEQRKWRMFCGSSI